MRQVHFDRILVAEISIKTTPPNRVEATGVFVNSETGQNHGWTKSTSWSKTTLDLVRQLAAAMAQDLEAMHFSDSRESPTTTAGTSDERPPQGLTAFLKQPDDDPVPQG